MGMLLLFGVFGMGIGFSIMGQVRAVWIAAVVSFTIGIFTAIVGLPIQVLLQTIVPGKLLGRVGTSLVALFSASQPIGSLFAGAISTPLTTGASLSLMGVSTVVSIVAMAFLFKDLRFSGLGREGCCL
jgi:hypothetical protein